MNPPGAIPLQTPLANDPLERRHWKLAVAAGMASYLDAALLVSVGVTLALWQSHFAMSARVRMAPRAPTPQAVAVGALLGGRIADLIGRQRVFTLYILFYALGMTVMTLSVSQPMLFVGIVIAGLAAGADLPTSVAVVSERAPAHAQGRLVSTTQLMWVLGIAITMGLGFVFSNLGILGARLIFAELALVAVATWAIRRFDKDLKTIEEDVVEARRVNPALAKKISLKEVFRARALLVPMVLTGLFYIFFGLVANTFGQFQTYFLITVGGASQSLATGLSTALIPIAIVMSLFVIKIMDTKWRNTVFVVGALIQVAAMVLAGFGNGVILIYVGAIALYNVGATIAGEANYKVWTQEGFPLELRATVQGLTYGVARFTYAVFAFFTPPLLASNPNALLWLLVFFSAVATVVGIVIFRYLGSQGIHPGQPALGLPAERAAVAAATPAA